MKPRSLLPNEDHIDWVIRSVKSNPAMWSAAWDAASTSVSWEAARVTARAAIIDTDLETAWHAALGVIRDAALNAALNAIWSAAYGETRVAASNVILALVAYDDCDRYLAMTYEQLSVYAVLSDKPQALLLLPMKWVQEHESVVTAS